MLTVSSKQKHCIDKYTFTCRNFLYERHSGNGVQCFRKSKNRCEIRPLNFNAISARRTFNVLGIKRSSSSTVCHAIWKISLSSWISHGGSVTVADTVTMSQLPISGHRLMDTIPPDHVYIQVCGLDFSNFLFLHNP